MDNVYIVAMKIGLENQNGIKYFDLKKKIEENSTVKFDKTLESTFIRWVGDSFDSTFKTKPQLDNEIQKILSYIHEGDKVDEHYKEAYDGFSSKTWVMKGTTVKQYLDYLELKESRIAATQARKQSNISIWIALVAIVISSGLGAYSIFSSSKPPYEVKIIENKTTVKQLQDDMKELQANYQEENKKIREELYKAEILIGIYEEEAK